MKIQIDIIWIFLATLVVYTLVHDITYSILAAFCLAVVWVFLYFSKDVFWLILNYKQVQFTSLRTNRAALERIFTYTILVAILGITAFQYVSQNSINESVKRMLVVYKNIPPAVFQSAEKKLQDNPNNPEYCTLLMMPLLSSNSQNNIARHFAYYKNSSRFCNKWWDWGQQNCSYLSTLARLNNSDELAKNLVLCLRAQNNLLAPIDAGLK